jgi:DNA-directed RNA polymerase subunit alpha
MENILLPTNISIVPGEQPNTAILTVEPCFYGYGTTLGNALRRVLLSTLPGAAVTAVKIKGATHEFQAVPNVKEDVLQIILNLKGLRMRMHSEAPVKLMLRKKGDGDVTAADFEPNADVEIVNPDLHLATVTDGKGEFEMEIVIERGRGYSPTEERKRETGEIGMIAIDALFSPIRNVGYRVENTRVGDITNFDKLVMTIETDGTVDPQDAIRQSAKILIDHFSLLAPGISEAAGESSDA